MINTIWGNGPTAVNGNSVTELVFFSYSCVCRDDGNFVTPFRKAGTDGLNMIFNPPLRGWITLCYLSDVHTTYRKHTFPGLIVSEVMSLSRTSLL